MLRKLGRFICNFAIGLVISGIITLITAYLCRLIYFRPYSLRPRVDSAVLVTFRYVTAPAAPSSGNELEYDLSLNVTLLNKHGYAGVHMDHLTAGLYYNGNKIGAPDDTLPSFKLKREARRTVRPVLQGRASNVSAAVAEAFSSERALGQFNLNVRIRSTLSYRFFPQRATYYYEYDCWLQFAPVPGDGTPAVTGGGFKCGVAK